MLKLKGHGRLTIQLSTLIIVIYAVTATAIDIPKVTHTVLEGDNLLVICNISESNETEAYWTKNDSKSTFYQAGKRLEILNIKRSSSGEYICHALNTSYPVPDYNDTDANKTVEVIYVDVQYPGEIDHFDVGPYTLMENRTLTVSCNFQANPPPTWQIRNRDNGKILTTITGMSTWSTITFTVNYEDSGFWECTGNNRLNNGVNATRGHYINVLCPPRPQFEQNTYTVETRVGYRATFIMNLVASPRANCTWYKDDGTDISTFAKQYDSADNKTMLSFNSVTVEAIGNYTLTMQNVYGIYNAHYQLITNGPPETPTNLNFSDVTYNSVTLRWTSGFDMGSRQHFIVWQIYGRNTYVSISERIYDTSANHGINQNWTYVTTGLESNTTYTLTVQSVNERNFESKYATPVTFTTKAYSYDGRGPSIDVKKIVGYACGFVGCVVIFALMAYYNRYRRLKNSYINIDEKHPKI